MATDIRTLLTESNDLNFTLNGVLASAEASLGVGAEIDRLGDFNGDGVADFLVAAPGLDLASPVAPRIDAGGGFVVYGGSALAEAAAGESTVDLSSINLSDFGFAVIGARADDVTSARSAGDVNGDGFADILFSAPSYVEVESDGLFDTGFDHRPGTAYILYGGADAAADIAASGGTLDLASPVTALTEILGEPEYARAGIAFTGGGDLNGDGFDDVVIGSFEAPGLLYEPDGSVIAIPEVPDIPGFDFPIIDPGDGLGRLYVVYGSDAPAATIDLSADIVDGDGSGGFLLRGYTETVPDGDSFRPDFYGGIGLFDSLAMADLDGDGRDELVIGSPFGGQLLDLTGDSQFYTGGLFVLSAPDTPTGEVDLRTVPFLEGPRTGELTFTGVKPTALGDINGDGIDDLAVTAPLLDVARGTGFDTNAGGVYGLFGDREFLAQLDLRDTLSAQADFLLTGAMAGAATPVILDEALQTDLEGDQDDLLGSIGIGIAGLGDIDGDGIDDFAIGMAEGGLGAGTVYLISGRTDDGGDLASFGSLDNLGSAELAEDGGVTALTAASDDSLGFSIAAADLGGGAVSLLLGAPGVLVSSFEFDRPGTVYVVDAATALGAESDTGGGDGGGDNGGDGGGGGGGGGDEVGLRIIGDGTPEMLAGGAGDDTITGGGGDDEIRGLAGNDDIGGQAGADVHIGGLGDDRYLLDDAGDSVIEAAGEGFDQVFARADVSLGGAEVEYVRLLGRDNLDVTGNGVAQEIVGNRGDNVLRGGGGEDVQRGGGGNDVFAFEFGNREATVTVTDFGAGDRLAIDDRFFGGDAGINIRPADAQTVASALAAGTAAYNRANGELTLGGDLVAVLEGGPTIGFEDVLLF